MFPKTKAAIKTGQPRDTGIRHTTHTTTNNRCYLYPPFSRICV